MKPHELISKLVQEAGGSLTVAKAMNAESFQGTLHKFISGHVESPKRSTAERIARHFDLPVDALYDERLSTKIANERGLTIAPAKDNRASQSDTTPGRLDANQETDSTKAHAASHSKLQDTHTVAAVSAGKQTVSPDEVFNRMSARERLRFAHLLAAAFDDPPEIGVTVEGELWVRNDKTSARPRHFSLEPQDTKPAVKRRASK